MPYNPNAWHALRFTALALDNLATARSHIDTAEEKGMPTADPDAARADLNEAADRTHANLQRIANYTRGQPTN